LYKYNKSQQPATIKNYFKSFQIFIRIMRDKLQTGKLLYQKPRLNMSFTNKINSV